MCSSDLIHKTDTNLRLTESVSGESRKGKLRYRFFFLLLRCCSHLAVAWPCSWPLDARLAQAVAGRDLRDKVGNVYEYEYNAMT